MTISKFLLASIMIISVSVLSACQSSVSNPTSQTNTQTPQKIDIAIIPFPGYAPLYLAQEKGLFSTGYQINVNTIESISDIKAGVRAGKIDFYASTIDMYLNVDGVKPIGTAVLALDESQGADALVSHTTTLNDIKKGSTIATEMGLPAHLLLMKLLKDSNVHIKDIKLQDMPTADAASLYIAGKVDIAGIYEPYVSTALDKVSGSQKILSSADTPGLMIDYLRANDQIITNTGAIQAVVVGRYKAIDYIKAHPQESYEIMAKYYGMTAEDMKAFDMDIDRIDQTKNLSLFNKTSPISIYTSRKTITDIFRFHDIPFADVMLDDVINNNFINDLSYE